METWFIGEPLGSKQVLACLDRKVVCECLQTNVLRVVRPFAVCCWPWSGAGNTIIVGGGKRRSSVTSRWMGNSWNRDNRESAKSFRANVVMRNKHVYSLKKGQGGSDCKSRKKTKATPTATTTTTTTPTTTTTQPQKHPKDNNITQTDNTYSRPTDLRSWPGRCLPPHATPNSDQSAGLRAELFAHMSRGMVPPSVSEYVGRWAFWSPPVRPLHGQPPLHARHRLFRKHCL